MSEVTRRPQDPVQRQAGVGSSKDPNEQGSRFPVQLKGKGLGAQERGLSPDAQPGFEAADAALRPVQKRASDDKDKPNGGGETKTTKPTTVNLLNPVGRGTSLAVLINAGAKKGMIKGEPVSWGHCQGVIDELYEFRSLVVFKGVHESALKTMVERFGTSLDVGAPKQAPPKEEQKTAGGGGAPATEKTPPVAAAKKPQFKVIPGTPKVNRIAGGRTGESEIGSINLPFRYGVAGSKFNPDALYYSGSFQAADMEYEALETLKRIVRADTSLQELNDDDLKPHVAALVKALKEAR